MDIRASQVAQWWRIRLPMQEMRVWSLDQEDALEKRMATHSYSCLGNPIDGGALWATVHWASKELEKTQWLTNKNHSWRWTKLNKNNANLGIFLGVQWLRIHLSVQGRPDWSLVKELRSYLLPASQLGGSHVPQLRQKWPKINIV